MLKFSRIVIWTKICANETEMPRSSMYIISMVWTILKQTLAVAIFLEPELLLSNLVFKYNIGTGQHMQTRRSQQL